MSRDSDEARHTVLLSKLEELVENHQKSSVLDHFTEDEVEELKDILKEYRNRPHYYWDASLKMVERHMTLTNIWKDFYSWIIGLSLLLIATTNISDKLISWAKSLLGIIF